MFGKENESLDDFLERVNTTFRDEGELQHNEALNARLKSQIAAGFLSMTFLRRSMLGTVDAEAVIFNQLFPIWCAGISQSNRRSTHPFHLRVADMAEELTHYDVRTYCEEVIGHFNEAMIPVLPGTDEARQLSTKINNWENLKDITQTAWDNFG